MSPTPAGVLTLDALQRDRLGITTNMGGMLAEAAAICFEEKGHSSGVSMQVRTKLSAPEALVLEVRWSPVTGLMRRTYAEPIEATEYGACGLALLLIKRLLGLAVVSRARTGTGFDYWLGPANATVSPPIARLEVSGMLDGSDSSFNTRIKQKLKQTSPTDGPLQAVVVVVHYGRPISAVVQK